MACMILFILAASTLLFYVEANAYPLPEYFGDRINVADCVQTWREVNRQGTVSFPLYHRCPFLQHMATSLPARSYTRDPDTEGLAHEDSTENWETVPGRVTVLLNDRITHKSGGSPSVGGLFYVISKPRIIDGDSAHLAAQFLGQPRKHIWLSPAKCTMFHGDIYLHPLSSGTEAGPLHASPNPNESCVRPSRARPDKALSNFNLNVRRAALPVRPAGAQSPESSPSSPAGEALAWGSQRDGSPSSIFDFEYRFDDSLLRAPSDTGLVELGHDISSVPHSGLGQPGDDGISQVGDLRAGPSEVRSGPAVNLAEISVHHDRLLSPIQDHQEHGVGQQGEQHEALLLQAQNSGPLVNAVRPPADSNIPRPRLSPQGNAEPFLGVSDDPLSHSQPQNNTGSLPNVSYNPYLHPAAVPSPGLPGVVYIPHSHPWHSNYPRPLRPVDSIPNAPLLPPGRQGPPRPIVRIAPAHPRLHAHSRLFGNLHTPLGRLPPGVVPIPTTHHLHSSHASQNSLGRLPPGVVPIPTTHHLHSSHASQNSLGRLPPGVIFIRPTHPSYHQLRRQNSDQ